MVFAVFIPVSGGALHASPQQVWLPEESVREVKIFHAVSFLKIVFTSPVCSFCTPLLSFICVVL